MNWEPGDRVAIDSESHCYYDESGTMVGPEDRDDDTWVVRLDSGEEVEAYGVELTGLIEPAQIMPRGAR